MNLTTIFTDIFTHRNNFTHSKLFIATLQTFYRLFMRHTYPESSNRSAIHATYGQMASDCCVVSYV
jgi:hypothetical protein